MRKNMKCIILCIITLILIFSTLYYAKFRCSDIKIAFCSAKDNKLYIYNVRDENFEEVNISNELKICTVGIYSDGDYSYSVSDEYGNNSIYLVRNNEITNHIEIPFCPTEILATNDTVFCHVDEKIYVVNISDNTNKIFTDDVCYYDGYQKMFLSSNNQLYYISKSDEGNKSLMCVNENSKNIVCNNISNAFGFISDSKFAYKDCDFNIKVIDVNNGKSSFIKRYGNICGPISLSKNKKAMVGYYPTGESGGFAIMKVIDTFSGIRFITTLDNFKTFGPVVMF